MRFVNNNSNDNNYNDDDNDGKNDDDNKNKNKIKSWIPQQCTLSFGETTINKAKGHSWNKSKESVFIYKEITFTGTCYE